MDITDSFGVVFSEDKKTLTCCPETLIGEFIIPDGATKISLEALYGCTNLVSIQIPEGYKKFYRNQDGLCDRSHLLMEYDV